MTNLHITDLEWSRFWQNQLPPAETDRLLEHVCGCEICSARMAEGIPEERRLTAPGYLKTEAMARCSPMDKPYILHNGRLQLFTYSLKVGLAAAAVLLLLLHAELPEAPLSKSPPLSGFQQTEVNPGGNGNTFSLTAFLNDSTNYITQKLNDFSSNLLYKEDLP